MALTYLQEIGVDPSTSLVGVYATHWHNDHIRGISALLEAAAPHCVFTQSLTMEDNNFKRFLAAHLATQKDPAMASLAEGHELRAAWRVLKERRAAASKKILAVANTTLLDIPDGPGHGRPIRVTALSPSSATVTKFLSRQGFGSAPAGTRRPGDVDENHAALVIWVSIGEISLLLGSDLEHNPADSNMGWQAIVDDQTVPKVPAGVFKIPHHGSSNGHCDDVWNKLLVSDCLALLTPYRRSELPTDSDIERIKGLAHETYLTAPVQALPALTPPSKLVEPVPINASTGRVTLRRDVTQPVTSWQAHVVKPATKL